MAWPRIVALVAICSLAGCVEEIDKSGGVGWAKPDVTQAGFQKDADECRRASVVVPVRYAGPASVAAERRSRYNDCMIERGYTLESHIPNDLMKEAVDCKLPAVEQVQRMSARDCNNRYGKIL